MRRRSDRRAFVVPALVLALAGYGTGPILEAAHLAWAAHAVCPEHGELTHRSHDGHDEGAPGAGIGRAHAEPTTAHAHCTFAEHQSSPFATVEPPPDLRTGIPAVPAEVAGSPARAVLAALRVAPKQSPPPLA